MELNDPDSHRETIVAPMYVVKLWYTGLLSKDSVRSERQAVIFDGGCNELTFLALWRIAH